MQHQHGDRSRTLPWAACLQQAQGHFPHSPRPSPSERPEKTGLVDAECSEGPNSQHLPAGQTWGNGGAQVHRAGELGVVACPPSPVLLCDWDSPVWPHLAVLFPNKSRRSVAGCTLVACGCSAPQEEDFSHTQLLPWDLPTCVYPWLGTLETHIVLSLSTSEKNEVGFLHTGQ